MTIDLFEYHAAINRLLLALGGSVTHRAQKQSRITDWQMAGGERMRQEQPLGDFIDASLQRIREHADQQTANLQAYLEASEERIRRAINARETNAQAS